MFQSFVPLCRWDVLPKKRAVELHAIGIENRFVAVRVAGAAPRHPGIQTCKHRYSIDMIGILYYRIIYIYYIIDIL